MPLSIKVNLRVTGHCNQGGRKYMEDMFSVAYQQTSDDKDLEYAFFGIFDGHGGGEAATFAKEHLMDIIVKQKNFWSDKDEDVLRAIRDGYVNTHYAMWRELDKWPRTASGLPSTAGTTASIAFIRKGKIYIGHVGDSGIILGYQEDGDPQWKAKPLTRDHKPESGPEMMRIQESGGKVVSKSGVPRVVWNRPRIGHKGPVRRSTHIDEIPFLAVARSLGDLWSYNSELDTFVVSPEPDVKVITVDVKSHRCLIFGTDGLWNMLTPQAAVSIVQAAERHNEKHFIASQQTGNGADTQMWINPSKSLVDRALERWSSTRLRADNTSVVTLMLDPPGPSRGEVLLSRKKERIPSPKSVPVPTFHSNPIPTPTASPNFPPQRSHSPVPEPQVLSQPPKPEPTILHHSQPPLQPVQPPQHPPKTILQLKPIPQQPRETKPIQPPKEPPQKESSSPPEPVKISPSPPAESIQVAEVSSSDGKTSEPRRDTKRVPPDAEEPDSPSKDPEIPALPLLPTVESSKDLQKMLLKADTFKITRQNAFANSCDDLKNGPRLRRSAQFSITTCKEVSTTLRRRTHSTTATHLDKRTTLLTRTEVRTKRRQSAQVMPATSSSLEDITADCLRQDAIREGKRRHSSTFEKPEEPSSKRRTRSEDRRCPGDENDPANQEKQVTKQRVRWPGARSSTPGTSRDQEKLPSPGPFQRRSLEKKATPVKTIRRPSINGSSRTQLRGSFALRDWDQSKGRKSCGSTPESSNTPQRWLRSDTIAATPIKTLRSRNVDITGHTVPPQVAHQYGIAKPNRIGLSKIKIGKGKIKPSGSGTSSSVGGVSGIARRVKSVSPYNPSARSFNTRSRLKRLGK